jgi:hypothetical protein
MKIPCKKGHFGNVTFFEHWILNAAKLSVETRSGEASISSLAASCAARVFLNYQAFFEEVDNTMFQISAVL